MKSYRQALDIIRQVTALRSESVRTEQVATENASGRICAEDIFVTEAHPLFDNSAMDGFAVRSEWTIRARNDKALELEIIGIVAAGSSPIPATTQPCAFEIMTGAQMPQGFDSVIRVEDAHVLERNGKRYLRINEPHKMWDQVRRRGEDYAAGELLVKRGTLLNSSHVLALASQGIAKVKVKAVIRIGLISTGSEIVPFAQNPGPAQIRNTTHPFLYANAQSPSIYFEYLGSAADSTDELKALMGKSLKNFDVIITTGAVSVGRFDLVPPVVTELGAKIHFHKVAMRPGKPLLFADFESGPLFMGFPGNPISSVVAYRFFLDPLLRNLLGGPEEKSYRMKLAADVKKPEDLCCFWKAELQSAPDGQETRIASLKGQESFRIKPLTLADHWAIFPEGKALYKEGDVVNVYPLAPAF